MNILYLKFILNNSLPLRVESGTSIDCAIRTKASSGKCVLAQIRVAICRSDFGMTGYLHLKFGDVR
jgi:hypothetical protein